jgi:hypothetical protein
MKYLHLSIIQLLVTFSFISAMKPNEFCYKRPLQKTDTTQSEPAVFRMDKEIYRHTKNDFSDLRLFNDQDLEVAYNIRLTSNSDTATVREEVPMKLISFKKYGISGAHILLSRKKNDSIPEELVIETPLRNFEKKVSVLGSNDQIHWIKLIENQPIFDYSQFIDLRNVSVSFDKSDYQFLNVVIDTISDLKQSGFSRVLLQSAPDAQTKYTEFLQHQEPFRLDEITFYTVKKEINYGTQQIDQNELSIITTTRDTSNNSSIITLASNREPVSKLTISTTATNFSRQVTVFGTDDTTRDESWTQLASAEIFSLRFDNFKKEHSEILLNSSSRFFYYKLIVQNRDNQPISITGVMGSGPRHEVVFFHNGIHNLNVCYKADSSTVPQYDIETILQSAPVLNGNIWSLGKPEQCSQVVKVEKSIFSSKTVLIAALLLMVFALLILLFIAVKKVDPK